MRHEETESRVTKIYYVGNKPFSSKKDADEYIKKNYKNGDWYNYLETWTPNKK